MVITPKKETYHTITRDSIAEIHNLYQKYWKKIDYKPYDRIYESLTIKDKKIQYNQDLVKIEN